MRAFEVAVVGGGSAGIAVAAQLVRRVPGLRVAVIDGRKEHYYQPGWGMVAQGESQAATTQWSMEEVLPKGATFIQEDVAAVEGDGSTLSLQSGARVRCDAVVMAPGLRLDWDAIPGLRASLGAHGVCSNHDWDAGLAEMVRMTRYLEKGRAVFTRPSTVTKAPGAPMSAMLMFEDHRRRDNVRDAFEVVFRTPLPQLYTVPKYNAALEEECASRGVRVHTRSQLVEVRGEERIAVWEGPEGRVEEAFDMLHVVPPMVPPAVVAPLADADGMLALDAFTLQHPVHARVFGLGDAAGIPTNRGLAAVAHQAPVVARNVLAFLAGRPLPARYDGRTACPVGTHVGRAIRPESTYGGESAESMWWIRDQATPSRMIYAWEKYVDPLVYRYWTLKGLSGGYRTPSHNDFE